LSRTGDEIALLIEGAGAAQWDTLRVQAGPLIDVPTLGPILLHGVLRSELETHLATELGRFIQTPRVRARALIRVSVAGAVGRPGFYALPTDLRLSDVVTLAGGSQGGNPGLIRVVRGQDELWSFEELSAPVAEGRTLDEVGLQPGDRLIVVQGGGTSNVQSVILGQTMRTFPYIAIPALVGLIIR
jgi:protein involved in polysaccharide export with SLBB domain